MTAGAQLRDPWSTGDVQAQLDPLQFRRYTADEIEALNPVLRPAEPAVEIDTFKGKFGDGLTPYNELPYAFGVAGSGLTLPANSIAVNNTAGVAGAIGLDKPAFRAFADVPSKTDEFTPLANAFALHAAAVAGGGLSQAVNTTAAQSSVTTGVPLPASIVNGTPISGGSIPDYSFVFNIAVNRLSFQLSNNPLTYNAAVAGSTATGVTALFRDTTVTAHGVAWPAMPVINPVNYHSVGYSTKIGLGTTFALRERWEEAWVAGERWMHSFEFPTPQRIFPLQELISSHVIVPVPSAFQTWSPFPVATPWDFMQGDTSVGRYKLCVPLEGATQARIVVDWMSAGATAGSGAKLKAQYFNAGVWIDLAENSPASTIEVAIDTGIGSKIGQWGVIDNAAVALAAANGDLLVLRLVGFAASAAGSPAFATVRLQLK